MNGRFPIRLSYDLLFIRYERTILTIEALCFMSGRQKSGIY